MTALDGFGRFATCAVQPRPDVASAWARSRHGLDVRLMVIGHDFVRSHASPLDRLPKEGLGTGGVAVLAEQDIDDHAVLVNRSIEVPFLSLAEEEHLVDEPASADRTPAPSDLVGQARPEGVDPVEDGAMGHVDVALGQQLQDLPAG